MSEKVDKFLTYGECRKGGKGAINFYEERNPYQWTILFCKDGKTAKTRMYPERGNNYNKSKTLN